MAMDDGDVSGRLTEAFTVILHGSRTMYHKSDVFSFRVVQGQGRDLNLEDPRTLGKVDTTTVLVLRVRFTVYSSTTVRTPFTCVPGMIYYMGSDFQNVNC
jgi:hypothetical protein